MFWETVTRKLVVRQVPWYSVVTVPECPCSERWRCCQRGHSRCSAASAMLPSSVPRLAACPQPADVTRKRCQLSDVVSGHTGRQGLCPLEGLSDQTALFCLQPLADDLRGYNGGCTWQDSQDKSAWRPRLAPHAPSPGWHVFHLLSN